MLKMVLSLKIYLFLVSSGVHRPGNRSDRNENHDPNFFDVFETSLKF